MLQQQNEGNQIDLIDKYVSVATDLPELARFAGLVGQVKTVNQNGNALVEWLDYHGNVGWYDLDVANLKVVDKPVEEEKPKLAAKKPAAKSKPAAKGPSPLELLRQQGAAKGNTAKGKSKSKGNESKPVTDKPPTKPNLN